MKCYELCKCSDSEQKNCFVYKSYPNKEDLDCVKCWILNGAFQKGNKEQLQKCLNCAYYKEMNKDSNISHSEHANATIISCSGAINNDRSKSIEDLLSTLLEKHRFFIVFD